MIGAIFAGCLVIAPSQNKGRVSLFLSRLAETLCSSSLQQTSPCFNGSFSGGENLITSQLTSWFNFFLLRGKVSIETI
ncbi:MAG TPA: hypothetical protein ENF17_10325 [Candidatus Aminicenantes bacterium]|nr:hypothetical protein [Candidatus Aminicenantes bacterium]